MKLWLVRFINGINARVICALADRVSVSQMIEQDEGCVRVLNSKREGCFRSRRNGRCYDGVGDIGEIVDACPCRRWSLHGTEARCYRFRIYREGVVCL